MIWLVRSLVIFIVCVEQPINIHKRRTVRAGVPVANRPPLCLPALTVANLPQCGKPATLSGQLGSCLYITLSRGIVYFQSIQTHKTTQQHHSTITL